MPPIEKFLPLIPLIIAAIGVLAIYLHIRNEQRKEEEEREKNPILKDVEYRDHERIYVEKTLSNIIENAETPYEKDMARRKLRELKERHSEIQQN